MVTLVISDNLVLEDTPQPEPKTKRWAVGTRHPYVPDANVVRMFIRADAGGGIEIYSYSVENGSAVGMRDFIPMSRIRFVQEAMPLNVFAEELAMAESDGDDEDDEESEESETTSSSETSETPQASNKL